MGMLRSQQLWLDKLQGVTMIRATTVLTLVINAPPAVAGCLLFCFQPGDIQADSDEIYRSNDPRVYTQRQHLIVDYAEKQAVFRVPYTQVVTSYDLTTDHKYTYSGIGGDPGTIQLRSFFGPNYNGTLAPININVYLHYEDVELGPPGVTNNVLDATPPLFIAQMGDTEEGNAPEPILDASNPVVQREPKTDAVKKEKTSFKLSSILEAVSAGASFLGNAIPTIGEFAYPVSIVTSTAAKVVSQFGYSVLVNTKQYQNFRQVAQAYMAGGNGIDVSSPLSVDVDNEIIPTNAISPSGYDELSIPFLVSRRSWFGNVTYSASDTVGTLLAWWPVSPNSGDIGGDTTTQIALQNSLPTTEAQTEYFQPTVCGGVAFFF
jgi:hypothetical protein